MIEIFRKGLSEAKFKKVESAVRQEVIEKYGEGNPMFGKLLEIAINNRLAKLAVIPSFETWSKSNADVGAPTSESW
jgi:hypothetical protein